jgi:hypothetical protein
VGYDFAHAIIDDRSRLAYVELLDDERASTVTAFTARALDWFEARGIHAKRLMTDNAWVYVKNQSLRELLGVRQNQAPADPGLPTPDEREDRALSPDDGARVGLRHELSLTPPSQPSPATLAGALQHAQAALRDRQPATHQPRSQPMWAGQLASGAEGAQARTYRHTSVALNVLS